MAEKYLVNNLIMSIARYHHPCGSWYWYGTYRLNNGKRVSHYFGTQDPRPNFPRYEEPKGLVWLYGLGRWQSR